MTRAKQLLAFGLGLGPGLSGDIDASRIDFEAEKGPALCSACMLCAGLAATEVLKLVTGRGKVTAAPEGLYVDPFRARIQPLQPLSLQPHEKREHIFAHCFERFPALRRMHERELARREKVETLTNAG
jgi:hypothetical protein